MKQDQLKLFEKNATPAVGAAKEAAKNIIHIPLSEREMEIVSNIGH